MQQQPSPGNWYASDIGQLVYVRAVLYIDGHASHVVFEHANGKRVFVDHETWNQLSLELDTQRPARRGRTGDL